MEIKKSVKKSVKKAGTIAAIPGLEKCLCGCRGDYTEHSMRAGESGRSSYIIVR